MKKLMVVIAATAALAGAAAAVASAPPEDENWLQTSISGDRFEVAGGKIALAKSSTPAVRAYAQRLIRDHAKSLVEAVTLARKYDIGVPPSATPSEQWELNRLKNMPKGWFDAQYASLEVKDHNQDIEETGLEAREGQVYEIRQDAWKELPMLNMHLRLGKRLVATLQATRSS
jgi:putative membrane protein